MKGEFDLVTQEYNKKARKMTTENQSDKMNLIISFCHK
jgi:hypothetical protein